MCAFPACCCCRTSPSPALLLPSGGDISGMFAGLDTATLWHTRVLWAHGTRRSMQRLGMILSMHTFLCRMQTGGRQEGKRCAAPWFKQDSTRTPRATCHGGDAAIATLVARALRTACWRLLLLLAWRLAPLAAPAARHGNALTVLLPACYPRVRVRCHLLPLVCDIWRLRFVAPLPAPLSGLCGGMPDMAAAGRAS